MANNSILGLALPLAPVTLLFGAHVGFVVATMVSLAGTAAAWYFVLSRHANLGVPLVVLLLLVVARYRRDPWIRAFGISAVALASLTLGNSIWLFGNDTGIPGPYRIVGRLPLFESLVPSRLGLGVMGLAGIILAVVCDRIANRTTGASLGRDLRLGWIAALAAALVPILPTPLPVEERAHVPAFLADGTWRRYIDDKHSLVTFPFPTIAFSEPERWVANINLGVAIAHGYVLSPTSRTDLTASYNPAERPTTTLVNTASYMGNVPTITDADRQAAVDDLRYWHAAVVLVQPGPYEDVERQTAELLLGPGQYVGGAWIWNVRGIAGS